jgi:hypothetical protein
MAGNRRALQPGSQVRKSFEIARDADQCALENSGRIVERSYGRHAASKVKTTRYNTKSPVLIVDSPRRGGLSLKPGGVRHRSGAYRR